MWPPPGAADEPAFRPPPPPPPPGSGPGRGFLAGNNVMPLRPMLVPEGVGLCLFFFLVENRKKPKDKNKVNPRPATRQNSNVKEFFSGRNFRKENV